MEQLVLYNYNY